MSQERDNCEKSRPVDGRLQSRNQRGPVEFNPFASIVHKQRRLPLIDADMKEVKRNQPLGHDNAASGAPRLKPVHVED
jgi:hypothetical protein